MRYLTCILIFFSVNVAISQHHFEGQINNDRWPSHIYLSVIEDYRAFDIINDEQIITKVKSDSNGFFRFNKQQLDVEQKIYKLHIDNCHSTNHSGNHFENHCSDYKDILFIAKRTDSIRFPLSFESQIFCTIVSNNTKTNAFVKIDSLKEDMKFAYSEFRSKANRTLNNKKWFKILQDFGENLNEPLAELYIYEFLSNRSNQLHEFYLKDLQNNTYYDELLTRLQTAYPNSNYTKQYEAELTSDKHIINTFYKTAHFNWSYLWIGFLLISTTLNIWFFITRKKNVPTPQPNLRSQLTTQEHTVFDLLLSDCSNKAIAETLFISVSTVKTHVNNIYKKLNIKSRQELKQLFSK